jgi:hypothetical protein
MPEPLVLIGDYSDGPVTYTITAATADGVPVEPDLLDLFDLVLDRLGGSPCDLRTDGPDPTSIPGHAGTTTEHEVASTTSPGQPTGPTEQAHLQGEPTTSPRPPSPVAPASQVMQSRWPSSPIHSDAWTSSPIHRNA